MVLVGKDACVRRSVVNHDAVSLERRAEPDDMHNSDQREGADHDAEQVKRAVVTHFLLRFSSPRILSMLLFWSTC
ncbi:hypothetical protein [Roseovarius sp.]|uniref:hypothetical protein n=1 Tax=Roseovarius sp. TaxID=1486281 RepID=UPI003A971F5E